MRLPHGMWYELAAHKAFHHFIGGLILQVSEISGGITNILWKVAPAEGIGLEPVVLRVFGKQTDQIIDRSNEQRILLRVNRAGFGAQVCCTALAAVDWHVWPLLPGRPASCKSEAVTRRI